MFNVSSKSMFFIVFILSSILLFAFISNYFSNLEPPKPTNFIGVTLLFSDTKRIIDFVEEVKDYVNLIILGELNVTTNSTKLYPVFDYLHEKGLYFIPFMAFNDYIEDPNFFQIAKRRWKDHLLGVYVFDEPGGKQIDSADHKPVDMAIDYSDAKFKYLQALSNGFDQFVNYFNITEQPTIFTSDYALFWYDYSAGYNVVLSQFGWNQSSQLNIALCRGAANEYNSYWGTIITWTFRFPPYLQNSEQLYEEMVLAYDNGAKYVVVFNFPTNLTEYGVLTKAHLESIIKFSEYTQKNKQPQINEKIAYVLPENYGFGFRGSNDKIWGLWGPDELSSKIYENILTLLETYNSQLDITYNLEDSNSLSKYQQLIFWNGTIIEEP